MLPHIENPKNLNLPPGATDIFKEMFADYGRVVIKEEFGGGLSGGRVFLTPSGSKATAFFGGGVRRRGEEAKEACHRLLASSCPRVPLLFTATDEAE